MKICVLQPDYSTTGVDYKNYDPPRDLSALIPEAETDHVFLNKLTVYRQLKELKKKNYDVFVNLCEGYLEWEIPSIDVIHSFDLLNLPHTGPSARLYDPPKELMKYVAYCENIKTPGYVLIEKPEDIGHAEEYLSYPLFVKPAKAGDSLGVDNFSLVHSQHELAGKTRQIFEEYGPLLVEEYIDGREFTVLVAANEDGKTSTAYKPVEYIFPEGKYFKTYALKTSELHPDCNVPCDDNELDEQLRAAAQKIFKGFNGVGYARLDFRVNNKKEIYFLEINFTCSVFYTDGYEGSADFVLKYDGIGQSGFLRHIIKEGIARFKRKEKLYVIRGNAISGFGIYALRNISEGEIVFKGEGKAQRLTTLREVEDNWTETEKAFFRKYAYPASSELYFLWDDDPSGWAPQNHSCRPNTGFNGLNVVALRNIAVGEELTLDYATILEDNAEAFNCHCGFPECRGIISGSKNISVTEREKNLRVIKENGMLTPHIHH
jgi:D-alanine-D-alanine ligase-like ATP-grasp enzyme